MLIRFTKNAGIKRGQSRKKGWYKKGQSTQILGTIHKKCGYIKDNSQKNSTKGDNLQKDMLVQKEDNSHKNAGPKRGQFTKEYGSTEREQFTKIMVVLTVDNSQKLWRYKRGSIHKKICWYKKGKSTKNPGTKSGQSTKICWYKKETIHKKYAGKKGDNSQRKLCNKNGRTHKK